MIQTQESENKSGTGAGMNKDFENFVVGLIIAGCLICCGLGIALGFVIANH